MRTIHRPVLPFWLTKSSEAWKNKGLQLKVPQHLPLQVHNLHSSRSQITRSTNKEILRIIGGELWTFHPRNPKKFELTNGKFLPSWENLAFMGRWKSYWASVTLNQESSIHQELVKLLLWATQSGFQLSSLKFWHTSEWLLQCRNGPFQLTDSTKGMYFYN